MKKIIIFVVGLVLWFALTIAGVLWIENLGLRSGLRDGLEGLIVMVSICSILPIGVAYFESEVGK